MSSAAKIRELNDAFRKGERPELGRIMLTSSIAFDWKDRSLILHAVQTFDAFSKDNDPHKEHDFGSFEHRDETFFWKIDYYDRSMEAGSEDPADETKDGASAHDRVDVRVLVPVHTAHNEPDVRLVHSVCGGDIQL